MASFFKSPLLTIFLLTVFFSSNPNEARENKMFSKVTHHHELKNSAIFVGTSSTKNNVGEAKIPTIEAPAPSPTTSSDSENNEYYGYETGFLPPQKEEEEFGHEELGGDNNNKNNRVNGYMLASENYVSGNENSNKDAYKVSERQGMSDTRFMEGGKYYYDASSEQEKARDGNTKSQQRYVFDTMEEYEQYEESQHYVP